MELLEEQAVLEEEVTEDLQIQINLEEQEQLIKEKMVVQHSLITKVNKVVVAAVEPVPMVLQVINLFLVLVEMV